MARSTPAQLDAIKTVSKHREAEDVARAKAKIEAEELIKTRIAEARRKTNLAVAHAVYRLAVPKAQVANLGLGTSDRQTVYDRLRELPAELRAQYEKVAVAEEVPTGITVELHDEGLTVHLDSYFNPDLAPSAISGAVQLSPLGDVVQTDSPELDELAAENPLWGTILFGLLAVQGAL